MAAALLVAGQAPTEKAGAARFAPIDAAALQGFKLFDLGVADANDDGHLDVFTTNHKYDSRLLLGDGAGGLSESLVPLGLSPTQAFPGYEALLREPVTSAPGLYLFATDRDAPRDPFHIRATSVPAAGNLIFEARDLHFESVTGGVASTKILPDGSSQVAFDLDAGGSIDLSVEHIDLPVTVHVDAPTDPAQVHVGADAVSATSRDFVLSLRDRHGFGFADYDADGLTDLFITTGGLGGEILDPFFTGRQADELLLTRPGGYATATAQSGLLKGACRGRGVNVADFNGDGGLDLLEACDLAPPQLYSGNGHGAFTQTSAPQAVADTYRAVDLLGDRRPEVVAAVGDQVQVWRNSDGAWALAQQVRSLNAETPVQHLALGDYDNDGDLDVFAAAGGGNTMLIDVNGKLRRRTPQKLGLPTQGTFAASFVDYDNDGDLDLDLLPQGLFEATSRGFHRTGRLGYGPLAGGRIGYGATSWPDLNEDGRRDPISARGRGEFSAEQLVDLRINHGRSGHWLEVDLTGPAANAQAIGASVRVRTAAGWTYGWVGQSDDSRYSSGHYRLYFGLGKERRIEKLQVTWPDGSTRTLRGLRGDRIKRIAYARVR
ncbi:MAG: CRTAC1 family protein [Solirubrobacterales bacterium]|nr:CRTAC1 family protein [Solirubrobacterales bacterium]